MPQRLTDYYTENSIFRKRILVWIFSPTHQRARDQKMKEKCIRTSVKIWFYSSKSDVLFPVRAMNSVAAPHSQNGENIATSIRKTDENTRHPLMRKKEHEASTSRVRCSHHRLWRLPSVRHANDRLKKVWGLTSAVGKTSPRKKKTASGLVHVFKNNSVLNKNLCKHIMKSTSLS